MSNSDCLKKNLEFFSELTQRTLSDFHVTNTTDSLTSEIDEVRRFVHKVKNKKVYKIEKDERSGIDTRYKVTFSDGSILTCDEEDLKTAVYSQYKVSEEYRLIEESLKRKPNPLLSTLKIDGFKHMDEPKEIESNVERLFFMHESD